MKGVHGTVGAGRTLLDLGVRIGRLPSGTHKALTDVEGVLVGHDTLRLGSSGDGPVFRTGVTAILPHGGNVFRDRVEAAVHVINGFGKSVGLPQVRELGQIETPILLTSTLNVWRVADALVEIMAEQNAGVHSFNPVVCECNDGFLNEARLRPLGREHVMRALVGSRSGPVPEGNVGAGMGMSGFGYKAGIGTASRRLSEADRDFMLGALVLTNTGAPRELRVDGVPVGAQMAEGEGVRPVPGRGAADFRSDQPGDGSIIIVMATDAPLSARQLGRVARRGGFGLARTGATAAHGSGDFVLAFSTTAGRASNGERLPEEGLTVFFEAAIEATEEAIVRSLLAAETVVGRDGHVMEAIPHDRLAHILRRNRVTEAGGAGPPAIK